MALESGGSGGVVWRIRANQTKLVCAVGSRNGTEETKLLVLDFEVASGGSSSLSSLLGISGGQNAAFYLEQQQHQQQPPQEEMEPEEEAGADEEDDGLQLIHAGAAPGADL